MRTNRNNPEDNRRTEVKRTERKPKSNVATEDKSRGKPDRPVLRFSPTAWAKLLYFRDKTDNEVGGFGISESQDLLRVTEFLTVRQNVSAVSFSFDDDAVADFFDEQVDLGRRPEQFARIWLHSHPADSPEPSLTDEETFDRVFGRCEWAVMFIVDQENHTYARLRFNVGPGGQIFVPVGIDYSHQFGPSDHELWTAEYEANVKAESLFSGFGNSNNQNEDSGFRDCALPYDFIDELENMDPAERQFILDELGETPDPWDEEREVIF